MAAAHPSDLLRPRLSGRPLLALMPAARLVPAALLLWGCASGTSTEPAWPEQASPAYPGTTETQAVPSGPSAQPAPSTDAAETGSPLAKQYGSTAALEVIEGKATYYADSLAGNHTANGDVYDPKAFTAAHKKLPFGTVVRVVRVDNGKATYARINDRGPFGPADRVIDLSRAAADELDMAKAGVLEVRVEVLERPAGK